MSDRYVRVSTALNIIRSTMEISRRQVYALIDSGRIRAVRVAGVGWRVLEESVREYLDGLRGE